MLAIKPEPKQRTLTAWIDPAFLAICAILLAVQILIPPFIGLADNGDFPKVAGPLSIGPKPATENFIYFVADYVHSPRYYWQSLTRSTELPLAWLATRLAHGDTFDIRWLGAVHSAILLSALYALLRGLRGLPPWRRVLIATAVLIVFTDVAYVAYFNSFYTDTAALLGLLLATALAAHIAVTGFRPANATLFTLAALLFIGSKPPHALWGFLFAAFLVLTGRKRGLAAATLLVAASLLTVELSPPGYTVQPLFTLIFSKLAKSGPEPEQVLRELGLGNEDAAYVGMHAFRPEAPIYDPQWLRDFTQRVNYRAVLKWYLAHPLRTLSLLDDTLKTEAYRLRPPNLSNFRRDDGHPPGALTHRFALWCDFRAALYREWPHHVIVWYLLVIAGSIRAILQRRAPLLASIALGIVVLATGEFAVAALADAAETYRHLFIFHACTDLTVCLVIAATLSPKRTHA